MKELFELGKNLLLLFIVFLVAVFISSQINKKNIPQGASLVTTSTLSKPISFPLQIALVTRVIDGDTVVIEGGKSVRLLGIDADEHNELCFEQAKDRLKELVLSRQVELQRELRDGDVYGRLLRYIFLNGQNVDLELVKEGLAVARASYEGGIYDKQFADAEYAARQNKIGCKWSK